MSRGDDPEASERILILTPAGRDAVMVRERIVAEGLPCEVCADLPALLVGLSSSPGAAIVAQEALSPGGAEALLAVLESQEPWSDIPVLLLSDSGSKRAARAAHILPGSSLLERGNVTLLERPLGVQLFLSSVRAAVRARRRQYQMRDLHRELERAVQISDLFVSILGHDLRNPISAIRMAAESIVRITNDSRALRPAGRILTSASRMNRMIEQLLDFARARQGQGIPLHPDEMHLGDLCRQAVLELEDANPEASLHFQDLGDLSGLWDADRLAQVVTNLVANAVHHGTKGAPITIEVDGTDASTVRLRVRNSGTIPPDALPTLFEAFQGAERQGVPDSRRRGLGLGLFIAREITRAHGGEIHAESLGGRTTFEVVLPRRAPAK